MDLTAEQVLKQDIEWETYRTSQLITETTAKLLHDYDHKSVSERTALLDQDGASYVRAFLEVLRNVSSDETLAYVLVLIDEILAANPARVKLFYEQSLANDDIYQPFLRSLQQPNLFVQEKSCKILTTVVSQRPKYQNGTVPNGRSSSSKSTNTNAEDVIKSLVKWVSSQLNNPENPSHAVPLAINSLSILLREPFARSLFVREGGVKQLIIYITPASTQQSIQLLYESCLCLWLLSFNDEAVEYFSTIRFLPKVVEVVKGTTKEKVVRIILLFFRNILGKGTFAAQLIDLGLPQVVQNIKAQAWTDEDLLDALDKLEEALKVNIKQLSSYDKYKQEVLRGQLEWSPMHKDPSFWRDNISNFEENDFQIVRALLDVIDTSDDKTALAVACYDLSQFIQYHSAGKIILADLKVKDRVMKLMNHDDPDVRKNSLVCIQRLFLGAKYASFLNSNA